MPSKLKTFALATAGLIAFAQQSANAQGPSGSYTPTTDGGTTCYSVSALYGNYNSASSQVKEWDSGQAQTLSTQPFDGYDLAYSYDLNYTGNATTTTVSYYRNGDSILAGILQDKDNPDPNVMQYWAKLDEGGPIECPKKALEGTDLGGLLDNLETANPALREKLIDRLQTTSAAGRRQKLGRLVSALLLPKNVTAAGGLATQAYVNDLADTILERLPMRQFTPITIEEEITEVEVEETITEPVRGLWKTSGTAELDAEIATLTIDDTIYAENPNLTSIYTEPNGTRVWARGFGGSKQPYKTGGEYGKRGVVFYPDVYNDFYSSHSGIVVGVDTSLTENIQLGIFGNYGDINLTQFAGASTGGGSWNPSGFGGGVMASYWEDNFYVQGLFGATAFSGDNKRQVKVGNILNETYTATKDTTSYVGALRVGAPLTWGSLILEPQATAIWNGNEDASYKESGRYRALALKVDSYSDNFLETTVGAKLAWPIKQGTRNLLVPNLKVAWLADWDTGNEAVKFKRAYTRRARSRTAEIPSNQETQNGVLVEGGIDYAIFQGPTSGWKLYAKGGAKIWADANTDWRTSGGITFQF